MQVAAFAQLVADQDLAEYCRSRFKRVLVSNQIAPDGSFPEELRRTKPYGYSLFNLDAFATICELLSTERDNLWTFTTTDGRSVSKAVIYMYPYIKDKQRWPLKPDVMYYADWPMRHCSLLFAGRALGRGEYIELWKTLPAESNVDEVIRNFFVRQPLLWPNSSESKRKV